MPLVSQTDTYVMMAISVKTEYSNKMFVVNNFDNDNRSLQLTEDNIENESNLKGQVGTFCILCFTSTFVFEEVLLRISTLTGMLSPR